MPSILDRLPYAEVWAVDTEYRHVVGEIPIVHCVVGIELKTGRRHRVWLDQFDAGSPFGLERDDVLMVAYMAAAECGSFRAIGWPQPAHVLDLWVEFTRQVNGRRAPFKTGLLGALRAHGLPAMLADEKETMRELAIRGGPFTEAEKLALLDYCEQDVIALQQLLPAMLPSLLNTANRDPHMNLMHMLLRGRYMKAVSYVEQRGAPLDAGLVRRLRDNWQAIQAVLVAEVDSEYGVYDGVKFNHAKFDAYLKREGIPWPRTPSGRLATSEKTFEQAVKDHPKLRNLRELQLAMGVMRRNRLVMGQDGHNRVSVRPFKSKTGRNQPSNSEAVFGAATWIRGLVKPPKGYAVAYIDWAAQEIAIAAALSGDQALKDDYQSDPYLGFAKRAGKAPADATKATHGEIRNSMKPVMLGLNYGRSAASLADALVVRKTQAEDILRDHQLVYPDFWSWVRGVVDYAMYTGSLHTVGGWNCWFHTEPADLRPLSSQNYLLQANGAEQMRFAVSLAVEQSIDVVAIVHDALLVMAPDSEIDDVVKRTQDIMEHASRVMLGGFTVRTDAKVVRYPDRYMDGRGADMWAKVMRILECVETQQHPTYLCVTT